MIKFRKVSGKHVNPISHTAEMLKKKKISALHIGTDSQRHQKSIVYVTAIAYRYKNKGVHYIYNKLNHKPIKDDWPRLWLETEYTMEVAKLLRKNFPKIKFEIDMDYNSNPIHMSNKLITAAKGWALSFGYKVNVKPNLQIATRAANYHNK